MKAPKAILYCMICKHEFVGRYGDRCVECGLTIPVIVKQPIKGGFGNDEED